VRNKIDSVEHCERLLKGIDWAAFWTLQDQAPPENYPFMTIANGLLSINLNSENGLSFLFVTFEHFASCIENLSDVYSVLLNELWTAWAGQLSTYGTSEPAFDNVMRGTAS
jgi:hypothetical protein